MEPFESKRTADSDEPEGELEAELAPNLDTEPIPVDIPDFPPYEEPLAGACHTDADCTGSMPRCWMEVGASIGKCGGECKTDGGCPGGYRCLEETCTRVIEDEPRDSEPGGSAGSWTDAKSGLTWQNPPAGEKLEWDEAKKYCDNLNLAGHTDWRLPTIDELRSLVRGCPPIESDGDCNITDGGCLAYSCRDDSCYDTGCSSGEGPADGCFWPGDLEGKCSWYWSSSAVADNDYFAWFVRFYNGLVDSDNVNDGILVRCVR